MNGVVQAVDLEGLRLIFHRYPDSFDGRMRNAIEEYATKSNPIYVGLYSDDLVCVFGFVVPSLLSDSAYLWLYTTDALNRHKIKFARHSARFMREMQELYPRIIGHCMAGSSSITWLLWLGAKFGEAENNVVPFLIEGR